MPLRRLLLAIALVPSCWASYILAPADTGLFPQSSAYSINSSQKILLGDCTALSGCHYFQAQGTTLTAFPAFSSVQDMNDAGVVMGRSGGRTVLMSDPSTTVVTLDASVRGLGLSNSGLVSGITTSASGFLYDGTYTYLTHGTDAVYANDVNNARTIVGEWEGGDHTYHAFVWSAGVFTELVVPGADMSPWLGAVATGINDLGQIVGLGYDASGNQFGWIYSSGAYTTVNFPGATSTQLLEISNTGDIVGNYVGAASDRHGFYGLSSSSGVPEPSTALLAGGALIVIALMRRRR